MSSSIRPDLSDGEFVAQMPKVELHVHIEGTIEPETLFRIAESNGVDLPYEGPESVLDYQAGHKSEGTENLANFLECLDVSRSVLRAPDDYHTIAVEFLRRRRSENVRHVEMMFDPQQAMRQGVRLEDCLDALAQARDDGLRDHDVRSEWIMCFQRDHPAEEAPAILEAAKHHSADIVGIGLDNYETAGFPAMFGSTFEQAGRDGFRLTSHCDVNQPNSVEHIRACIEDLAVERIDHGLNCVDDPSLLDLVLEKKIALTGCPTYYAGQRSSPAPRLKMHRTLADAGVLISLNTDDPAQFGSGWITNTIESAMRSAPFTRSEIVRFAGNAIESAWIDGSEMTRLKSELSNFCAG